VKIDPAAGKLDIDSDKRVSIKIEPGQTIPFPIRFISRISKVVKGKVIFTNKREGNVQAAAMVFELVSNVYERNSVMIEQKSTKLYKLLVIDLPIENGFNTEVTFNVQVQYERSQVQAQKDKKQTKNAKDMKKGNSILPDKKTSTVLIPEPFTVK
jgi:hypothetical protein